MAEPKVRRKNNISDPMVKPLERSKTQKSYFFLDGVLYKMLRQERASDLLTAQNYDDMKMYHFVLSDVKKRMHNAYSTTEVARLLNRTPRSVQDHVNKGSIVPPKKINFRGMNSTGHPFSSMKWNESDVLALHEHLLYSGRDYGNGIRRAVPRLPTRSEVVAMMRNQPVFYMKTVDGDYLPVWQNRNG